MERYFPFFRRSNRRNLKRSRRTCISNGEHPNTPEDVQYTKFNMADLQLLHVLDFLFEDDEDDLHGTDDDVVTLFGPLLVKML